VKTVLPKQKREGAAKVNAARYPARGLPDAERFRRISFGRSRQKKTAIQGAVFRIFSVQLDPVPLIQSLSA
jgi:hypothetical protein